MSLWHERLRAALKSAGYTFEDVANDIGVTRSAVGHYLRGTREPSVAQLTGMCRLAGKTLDDIVGDDPMLALRKDERALIQAYRQLTPDQRTALLALVQQFSKPG